MRPQWGLDFRPDYLNSTNVNLALKEKSEIKFPLLLFSATVSEQVYKDIQRRFNGSINRLENYPQAYNPLREHIAINFEMSEDANEKLKQIAEELLKSEFDPDKSRCLVFVRTRNQAEEVALELEKLLNELPHNYGREYFTDRVSYFHAGLNAIEREERYLSFKLIKESNSEIEDTRLFILVATKAFGMGMDIPNIHYVYHYEPSGTLEDFLQEVGRAGRNATLLMDAGYSNDSPIQAKCFLEGKDFGKLKDLLQKNKMTWNDILSVFQTIQDYYLRFRGELQEGNQKPIILPFNL